MYKYIDSLGFASGHQIRFVVKVLNLNGPTKYVLSLGFALGTRSE